MIFSFGHFEIDTERQELRRCGQQVPIAPKTFSVLSYLVNNRDRMVPKAELMDTFWSRNVSESALQKTVSLLRKALDDTNPNQPILKTLHGRGFRFVPELSMPEPTDDGTQKTLQEQRQIAVLCLRMSPLSGQAAAPGNVDVFLEAARARIEEDQGRLLHMMVDRFTVSFGLDPEQEDSARRAVQCAWHLSHSADAETLRATNTTITIGVDVGPVVLNHNESDPEWRAPSAIEIGAVTLAESAVSNAILLSDSAFQLLRDEVEVTKTNAGLELVGLSIRGAGIPARPSKRPTGFVGRTAELAFLDSSLAKMWAGTLQSVALYGPAGIGKSRLTSEFLGSLSPDGMEICKIHCAPRLQNSTLAPVRQMCTLLLRDAKAGIAQDPTDTALLELLVSDVARPNPILEALSDRKRNARNLMLIQKILLQASSSKPVVVVFEDVHWLDATSRATLQALVRKGVSANVFLLFTSRPTDDPSICDSVLSLSQLGPEESRRLIRAMPEQHLISEHHAAILSSRAEGNPFFLEELVLATQSGADPRLGLPNTVQAVIEVRIGALGSAQRMVLYIMAIVSDGAALDLMAQLAQRSMESLELDLVRLVEQGFLFEDETGFEFRHALLSDTAYAMVEDSDRRQLHAEVACYLEMPDHPGRDEILAWHHQEAGNTDSAIRYWTKASYAAIHRSARTEAVSFAQSGLALIDPDNPEQAEQELHLQLALATALMAVRGYGAPEVGQSLERALEQSARAGSVKSRIRVLMGLWVHTWVAGRLTASLEHATTLLGMARVAKDPSLDLQAHASTGEVLTHLGRLDEAAEHLGIGLQRATEVAGNTITNQNAAVTCAAYAAWGAAMKGREGEMLRHIEMSRALSQVRENLFAEAIHLALCSEAHMFVGDVAKTSEMAIQAVALSREQGFPFWLGTGLVIQGWALGQTADFDKAFAAIDEGISVFERTGAGVQFTNWYGLKAETHLRAGQVDAGLEAASKAIKMAERTQDVWFMPRVHSVLSALHKMQSDPESSRLHASLAEQLQAKNRLAASFVVPALD